MNIYTRLYYGYRKIWKAIMLYFMIAGPGIVVMVADNDFRSYTSGWPASLRVFVSSMLKKQALFTPT